MLTAIRIEQVDHKAKLDFYFDRKSNNINLLSYYNQIKNDDNNNDDDNITLGIEENTYLVDGIGGTTWDGSLILGKLLEHVFIDSNHRNCNTSSLNKYHIIELGCGSGLIGLVCSTLQSKVTLTDRYCDLASINVEKLKFRLNNITMEKYKSKVNICAMNLSWEDSDNNNIDNNIDNQISNFDSMSYSSINYNVNSILDHRGYPDIIIGAEITCLIKQQYLLVNTMTKLCNQNFNTIILLSFDGAPQNGSKYENQMIQLMKDNKFMYSIIYTGKIRWFNENINYHNDLKSDTNSLNKFNKKISKAFLYNETNNYYNDLHSIYFPNPFNNIDTINQSENNYKYNNVNNISDYKVNNNKNNVSEYKDNNYYYVPNIPNESKDNNSSNNNTETLHHIIAFYRPNAINTCKRCHKQFFKCNLFNTSLACKYHKGLYVCRKHPAEINCSIDGKGDGLGYYGNGESGWEAKFWDCCGSEDPDLIGCTSSPHIKYD